MGYCCDMECEQVAAESRNEKLKENKQAEKKYGPNDLIRFTTFGRNHVALAMCERTFVRFSGK